MKNFVQHGKNLVLRVGIKKSGDPVAVGEIVGVCVTDADTNGTAVVATEGVYKLTVVANDGTADVAIGVGDAVYLQTDGTINKDSAGKLFGYALEDVSAGAAAVIAVKLAAK